MVWCSLNINGVFLTTHISCVSQPRWEFSITNSIFKNLLIDFGTEIYKNYINLELKNLLRIKNLYYIVNSIYV